MSASFLLRLALLVFPITSSAQMVVLADIVKPSPCLASSQVGEVLFTERLKREKALQPPPPAPTQKLPDMLALAKELSESKNYDGLSPAGMRSLVFLACHYRTDSDITPLVAKLIMKCEGRNVLFEPIMRCAERVMLGLPPE